MVAVFLFAVIGARAPRRGFAVIAVIVATASRRAVAVPGAMRIAY